MNEKIGGKVSTRLLIKSSFWYTISSFLTRAIVFITTPIFTRILSKEQYGNFTVYASWQNILVVICGLEVYSTLNRARFDFNTEKEFNAYITSCLTLSTLITAIVFAAYLMFPNFFYRVLLLEDKYITILFLYLFTFPAYSMFQIKQRVQYKYKLSAIVSFVIVILSAILAVVFSRCFVKDRLFGRVLGQYVLYIAAGCVSYVYFLKKSVSVRFFYLKYALRIALPLVFSYLASNILLSSDSLIVKHMCMSEQVSYLSVTHTCVNIILLFVQVLNNAWSPWFYDKLNDGDYAAIKHILSVYIWLIILGTFGILLIAPEIISILGGKQYMEALNIIPVTILNGVFTALIFQFANLETFYKKPEYAAMITGIAAIINIVLDIICVRMWGYRAVCYVTAFCQIFLVIIHYYVTIKMDIDFIIPKMSVFIYIFTALALIPFSLAIYQYNIIRWGVIAVVFLTVGGITVFKRKEIGKVISKFKRKKEKNR